MKVMLYHAKDDLEALLAAQAMEEMECDVFSITSYPLPSVTSPDAPSLTSRHVVWCKYSDRQPIYFPNLVHEKISNKIYPKADSSEEEDQPKSR